MKRRFRALVAALAMMVCAAPLAVAQTAMPEGIPDFSQDLSRPSVQTVQSGSWSSPSTWQGGVVPTSNHIVRILQAHTVTIQNQAATAYTVSVDGKLAFDPTVNTRLYVTNLQVMAGNMGMGTPGVLEVGTVANPIGVSKTAEIVIANNPLGGSVSDVDQFGTGITVLGKMSMHGSVKSPTFVRLAAEPRAGQSTLTLAEAVTGWAVGDRLILPDTRHMSNSEVDSAIGGRGWVNKTNQWEELTVADISPDGRTVTLQATLLYDHLGARNFNNVLEFLPHVGNITRNVVVRSENPAGTRGHMLSTHMADVDIRYALFKDLGRTTYLPLNNTTNHIGRYPIHMHHLIGPTATPANGYQFTLVGNAVDGGSIETQFKWGITVHGSHYGSIKDNVVYNYNGAAIATEDGSESFNEFDHNFVMRGIGEPDEPAAVPPVQARMAMGTEGVGFWFRGPNNFIRNNVAANYQNPTTEASYGFAFQFISLGNIVVPTFKGADTLGMHGPVQGTTVVGSNLPLLQFENNEAYGAMQGGLTYWWINSQDPQPYPTAQETVIKNFTAWHTYNKTVYVYPAQQVTLDGLKIRGKFTAASHCCGDGVWFEDYSTKGAIIRNADIQGMEDGIQAPSAGFGPGPNLLVENSYLRNWRNINVPTPSSVNGCWMEDKLVTINNTRFDAPPGRSLSAINMVGKANGFECLTKLNEVRVYAFNGNAADNFQIYHPNTAVLPRPPLGCTATAIPGVNGLLNPTTLVSAPTCAIAPIVTASSITSPPSGATLASDTQLFQWSTGSGVSSYQLFIGTFEGGTDVYAGAPTTDTSVTVTGLPTHGGVVWARLYSNIGGAWQYVDASYTAAGVPLFVDLAPSNMVSVEGVEAQTTPPFNAAKNDLLLAFVASSGPAAAGQTMTVSGGGLAWSLVKRANSQFGVAEIWKATAALDLTGITVTSTPTQSSPSQSLVVLTFAGTGGIGASAAASGATGAPSVSLTATKTGSFVYGVGNDWNGSVSRTVGTNQSILHEYLGPNGDTFWVQRLNGTVPLIGTLITLNDSAPTDHSWNFAAVEIIPMQRIPPPITWPTPADIVYGTPLDDTQLNATTEVAGTFVYTPPAGTFLNAGANQTLSVTFTPANSTTIYGPATATVPLNVLKAPSFVTWVNPADIAYGTALGAAQLNATANLPGTFVYSPPAGAILSAGNSQPLSVTFTPDDSNYQAVTTTVMINVTATTPVVIWSVPMPIVYGTALSGTQLNASAGVPGNFVYTPAAGTVLGAGSRTLSVTFTPTDTAFAPSTKTVPLTVLKATPVITWATPANIVAGTALSATQLNATVASPPGTLAYSPASGTVLPAGPAQRLAVTFTPTDTANYNVAGAAVAITVVNVAGGATPVKIGTTIAGTFSDATGHSGQSHLVFAPNANVWWLFTLSSAHDALGDRTVQTWVSSGPDLATATWSAKAVSPTLGNANGATSSVLAGGRSLGVAVRSIGGVDYAHVFVSSAFDGQTSSNGHARATLSSSAITWGAWNNPGSPNTASEWQGPLNSGVPPSAAATHTSWGNTIGISTGGFVHHFSVTLDQEVDCAVGRSTNADTAAAWTNGFGTNTSPTGLSGTSPPWTVAVIDKTMTNECKTLSFAPLASDFMLAVYSNGAVVQPNLTNLRYQKSGASGTWTNISASTGGGNGNVFSSAATINQNDWALVPVNTTTIYAFRRKATGAGIDAATYNVAGNSFAASAVQPPAFGTGQAFKAGGGLFGATDGTNVWLFVINTDTANSILYTQWNGTSWTAWATVPGTGTGSQTRNFITGNPAIGSGQAGLAWTQTNGSNFDVYATSFRTATAAAPATVAITAPANASTVATTVNVTANATPGGGTIAGVQFLLDGANLGAEDTASPYSVSWDTTATTNGTHFLTAIARDTNGGTGTASTVTVIVANDLSAPTVTMTAPANGASVSGASVSVSAEALDDIGVAGVQFLLDGNALGAEVTVAPYIISWNASTASAGAHTLSARARDGAGRQTTSATISVTVLSATPSITWPAPANIVYGTALSSTQLNASTTVPGTFAYAPPAGTVLPAGPRTLSVTFTPTDTTAYSTATATTTITVVKATPSITWPTPASIVYGTVLTATQLNATSGVAGTFAYTPVAGTVLAAGAGQTLSATFTPTDTANYTSATASVAITVTKATPAITWPAPASIVYGTTLSSTQLNATTSVPGTFAYTPVAGTVLAAGAGQTLSTTFTPTDPSNYTTATASVSITVTKATPSISWTAPANIVYGTALGAAQLNATTSVPGTFAYTPVAGTVLSAGAGQTLSTTFTPTDLANYTTATTTRTITVTKATPSITWPTPPDIVYGTALGAAQLNATSGVAGTFVYTPVAGTVLPAGAGQALSVTLTPTDAANYTTATASVSLNVLKASPVVTWPAPASIVYGTALGASQLNATADVGGSFVYSPAAGAVLDAGSQTLSVTFTPSNANYSSATRTVTLSVTPALPVLTLTGGHFTYDTVAHPASATATGVGGATVAGSFALTYSPGGAAAPVNAGSYGVTATFTSGNSNYSGGSATTTITIDPADPDPTWPTPADIVYGTPLGASQLNALASIPGTYVYNPPASTILNAGNGQVLSMTFTPTSPNYGPRTKTVLINVLKAAPALAWATPPPINVSTALTATQLNATANVPGAFAYTPGTGTVLPAGNQVLSVTFTPTDAANYNTATQSVTLRVRGLPSIATNVTNVNVGAVVIANVENGPANGGDWIGLYAAGGATYLDWRYLNGSQFVPATGLADASVPFVMPLTPGSYQLKFFGGGVLLATSATITIASPTLTLNASAVIGGSIVTATVNNTPGNAGDWIGVYAGGGSTLFEWRYLNGSQIKPATGVNAAVVDLPTPTTPGNYDVRLYTGGALLANAVISVTAKPNPSVTVSSTTATIGAAVTAAVANGPGNAGDWIGLYAVSDPAHYLDWKYLNGSQFAPAAGTGAASVSFAMPMTPGAYVLRFFDFNHTLLATSATVTVAMPGTSLVVNTQSVEIGGVVTATVTNGPGARTDWIALYPAGSSTYVDWKYLNGTQYAPPTGMTSATVTMTMPMTPGNYTMRLYTGSTLVASSATIVVSNGSSITLNSTTAPPGGTVLATVTNAQAKPTDWVGLFAANSSTYVDWKYLNGSQFAPASGITAATISFTIPQAQGTYSIRLYTGEVLLVVSPAITSLFNATMNLSATTVAPGETVTATVASGPGLPRDWIGLYQNGSSTLLDWKYLNGSQTVPAQGVSSAAVTFAMPTTSGSYVLRLASGSTILVTSPVTVQ